MRKIVISILVLVLSSPAFAQNQRDQEEMVSVYMTGEKLVEHCRAFLLVQRQGGRTSNPREAASSLTCRSYVEGVLDTLEFERLKGRTEHFAAFCLPGDTGSNAIAEVVLQYLETYPQHRGASGYSIVRLALARSYPC